MLKPELIRSAYIWNYIKNLIDQKWLTITEVAKKIDSSRPTINNMLNWRTSWTDSLYEKIMVWIWMTTSEIKQLFKKADLEAFKYKYNEEINILEDIDFDLMLSREYWITDSDAIKDIKKYIEFIKNKK